MKKWVYLLFSVTFALLLTTYTYENGFRMGGEHMQENSVPKYLYKILSLDNWERSESKTSLTLSDDDREFIHLAREDQVDKIAEKYWSNVPEYVILQLDTELLPGKLVFEANPGGSNKYYHLYHGSIPLKAVVDSKIVPTPKKG